jgi:hypothetical protein
MVLRLLAFNAGAWLAFNAYLTDPNEYRAILRNLLHLGGQVDYTTSQITVTLDRPDSPRVARALELLSGQGRVRRRDDHRPVLVGRQPEQPVPQRPAVSVPARPGSVVGGVPGRPAAQLAAPQGKRRDMSRTAVATASVVHSGPGRSATPAARRTLEPAATARTASCQPTSREYRHQPRRARGGRSAIAGLLA